MTFDPEQLHPLPKPVRRYFNFALTAGQRMIRRARFVQAGEMALKPGKWVHFTATEEFTVGPPSFVWIAKLPILPLLPVRVRDSYADGVGSMQAKAFGLFPVVNQWGTPEIASAALLRYLAEAAWLPTALLPEQGVRWEAVDEESARARLSDHGVEASATVRFGGDGEIAEIQAERFRDVKGLQVLTPWRGRFSKYRQVEGMKVPGWAEVEWVLPEGVHSYWRGSNVESAYEFA